MIRQTIFKTPAEQENHGFRLRGHEVKRIETFSDAVFAFAVTLLIVSLEVPRTFEELLVSMRGFFAFSICFTLLMLVWHDQHVFFRRYALDDIRTVVLNSILIFIVLFYVYPLKFLFSIMFGDSIYGPGKNPFSIRLDEVPKLMAIYGLGYIGLYLVFVLLYLHALGKRRMLELTAAEVFDTRTVLFSKLILVAVGCLSVALALTLPAGDAGASGYAYFLIGPALWWMHAKRRKIRKRVVLPLAVLLMAGNSVTAQYVGLGNREIRSLKERLGSPRADASLVRLYDFQKQAADQALKEDPHPIDTIRSEGLLQGDPKKTATQAALRDMPRIYALALQCAMGESRKYLPQLTRYLMAWATTDHPRGDPIDDTNLDPVIEVYDMVKGMLAPAAEAAVRSWLHATAEWEINAVYNRANRATSYNNWHSHRLKVVGEIAFATGDTALEGYTIRGLQAQIGRNLRPDGSSDDFALRDALHYHVYDLEPLLKLAIVLRRATGVNYYTWQSPTGSSIRKSVTWLLPYLNGEKTHPEFVHSTVEFDRKRAQNGEAAYKAGTLFDPKNGIQTLVLAGYFDPGLMPLARQLSGTDDQYVNWQAVVNGLETGSAGITRFGDTGDQAIALSFGDETFHLRLPVLLYNVGLAHFSNECRSSAAA